MYHKYDPRSVKLDQITNPRSSVGYRMAMFRLMDHSRPVRGADYFAGHFTPPWSFRNDQNVFTQPPTEEDLVASSVLQRYGESASFTYAMTHVYVDPEAGMSPVKRLSDSIRGNLERIRADDSSSSWDEEWLRGQGQQ